MSAIYLVETEKGKRLVQAGSKTVAINHVVKSTVNARAVTASELVELMDEGITVEHAGQPEAPTPPVETPDAANSDDNGQEEVDGKSEAA